MAKETQTQDLASGLSPIRTSNWFKFGKVGDQIRGKFISVEARESTDMQGNPTIQKVYDIEAEAGSFHNIIDKVPQPEVTELVPGMVYRVGGKKLLDAAMQNIQPGQTVLIRYTGDFKMKGGNSAKTIEVLA